MPVSGLSSGVVALTAGDNDTCAIASGGTAICWGQNFFGELGNNTPAVLVGAAYPPAPVLSRTTQAGVYSASIDPAAGIFASVDTTHFSLGIGSGWPNIATTFPGGILSDTSAQWGTVSSYALATNLATVSGHEVVNHLFPTGWPATNTTIALIGGGAVMIDPQAPTNGAVGTKGNFTATALTPMSAFAPQGGWTGRRQMRRYNFRVR